MSLDLKQTTQRDFEKQPFRFRRCFGAKPQDTTHSTAQKQSHKNSARTANVVHRCVLSTSHCINPNAPLIEEDLEASSVANLLSVENLKINDLDDGQDDCLDNNPDDTRTFACLSRYDGVNERQSKRNAKKKKKKADMYKVDEKETETVKTKKDQVYLAY